MTDTLESLDPAPDELTQARRLRQRLERAPDWVRWATVFLMFLVLSTALVGRFVLTHPALSRADEYVYIDAVDKASHGDITRQGDLIDQYSLALISCQGIQLLGPQGKTCGGPYDISTFPYRGGVTSADIHPPTYFFVTAWLAAVLRHLAGVQDLLIAARLTGAIWLAAGLTALVALARTLGASRLASGAVALLVLASPLVRWTNAYVTPDNLNLLAGSIIALGAVKYAGREWRPWFLIAASAVAAAFKAQNSIAGALAALFLVLYAATVPEGRTWSRFWRYLTTGVAGVAVALVVQGVYQVLRAHWAVAPAPVLQPTPLGWWTALSQSDSLILGTYLGPDSTFVAALGKHPVSALAEFGAVVLAAGLLSAAFVVTHLSPLQTRFAQATTVAYVVAFPAMYVLIWVATGRTFPLPERYGQVLMPAMAASASLVVRRRAVAWGIIVLAAAGYAYALAKTLLV